MRTLTRREFIQLCAASTAGLKPGIAFGTGLYNRKPGAGCRRQAHRRMVAGRRLLGLLGVRVEQCRSPDCRRSLKGHQSQVPPDDHGRRRRTVRRDSRRGSSKEKTTSSSSLRAAFPLTRTVSTARSRKKRVKNSPCWTRLGSSAKPRLLR